MVTLYGALQEFLLKFSQSTTSYSDYTNVEWYDTKGVKQSMQIPSIGFIKSDIDDIKDQFESLISNNDDKIQLKYKDGTVKSFEMKKISTLVDSLNKIEDTSFIVPDSFRSKGNWMFESFLNPLLSTSINVSEFSQNNDISKFSVRRIILNSPSTNDINFFDSNFKGINTLNHDDSLMSLQNAGVLYTVDDNEYDLPLAINRFRGSFNVIKIEDDTVNIDSSEYSRIYYTLDKMFYTDIINNKKGKTYLAVDDILLTLDDTEYIVRAVDKQNNRVLLERVFGSQPINIGVNVLKIKPDAYRIPELQINVGYNERQLIFVKPISNNLNLTTDVWSKGFGIYTNELNILMSDGQVLGLESYYNNYVSDFGLVLLNFAKEKQIPSSLGLTPITPTLNIGDFKVVKINAHLKDDKSTEDFKKKIANKESLKNQIDEINKSINDNKSKLNNSSTSNTQERLTIKKKITDLNIEKSGKQKELSTLLDEITFNIKSSTNLKLTPKYRVRGFTAIPEPRLGEYGEQSIIQMVYAYRYKSKSGNVSNSENIPFSENGVNTSAYFSNWQEVRSKVRQKIYDTEKGVYVWADEDVQDSDAININQIDIPINKGEIVDIKIKAVSEAGFPLNPLESAYSNTISIEFPSELEIQEEDSLISERLIIEDALVDFQNELNSRGLDNHLSDSIITGDYYYAHELKNIASGIYTNEGKIINSYEVINDLVNRITAIEKSISDDIGEIKVSIIDSNGLVYNINNGSTLDIFAGYYSELRTSKGDIQTMLYTLQIQNTSNSILELVSRFAGGIGEEVSDNDGTNDYVSNRRYDLCPISVPTNITPNINDFKQKVGYQSKQTKSQFLYNRYKSYNLANELTSKGIIPDINESFKFSTSDLNKYNTLPTNGIQYLPIFNNATDPTGNPDQTICRRPGTGNTGLITEFCISSEHPLANNDGTMSDDKILPQIVDGKQAYTSFSHALGFEVSVEDIQNPIGIKSYQQSPYIKQIPYSNGDVINTTHYPVKIGFLENDKYLIGKYTCGAYLYLSPNTYNDISVIGNDESTANYKVKYGTANAINIPIVFQFRCEDYKEYIGGYKSSGNTLENITYRKTLGVDIYQKLSKSKRDLYDDVFSFDITIGCKYKKDNSDITMNIPRVNATSTVAYNM